MLCAIVLLYVRINVRTHEAGVPVRPIFTQPRTICTPIIVALSFIGAVCSNYSGSELQCDVLWASIHHHIATAFVDVMCLFATVLQHYFIFVDTRWISILNEQWIKIKKRDIVLCFYWTSHLGRVFVTYQCIGVPRRGSLQLRPPEINSSASFPRKCRIRPGGWCKEVLRRSGLF